jgi:hypothetical protein
MGATATAEMSTATTTDVAATTTATMSAGMSAAATAAGLCSKCGRRCQAERKTDRTKAGRNFPTGKSSRSV